MVCLQVHVLKNVLSIKATHIIHHLVCHPAHIVISLRVIYHLFRWLCITFNSSVICNVVASC